MARTAEFHQLAGYLHRLATRFSAFYERCPVLRADGELRASRLLLTDLTGRTLRQGLHLLGIRTVERMCSGPPPPAGGPGPRRCARGGPGRQPARLRSSSKYGFIAG